MEWPSLIFNILMDWQGYPEVMIDDHHMGRIYTKQNAVRMMNVRNYICAKMGPPSHCWGSTWLHSGWSELFLWVWVIAQLDQNAKGLNWTKIKKWSVTLVLKKNTNIPTNIIYNIISDFWSMEVCVSNSGTAPRMPSLYLMLPRPRWLRLAGAIQLGLRWWGARSRCTPPPALPLLLELHQFGGWVTHVSNLFWPGPRHCNQELKKAMHACISWLNTWSSDKGFNQCGSYLDHSAALWSCDRTAPKIQNVSRKDVNVEGPAANII